jgi:hypothetical protein
MAMAISGRRGRGGDDDGRGGRDGIEEGAREATGGICESVSECPWVSVGDDHDAGVRTRVTERGNDGHR